MNDTDLMKLMNLSGELGLILGVNPVWEDENVVYGLGDDLIELSFGLDDGCWAIATDAGAGDYGLVRLPKEAIKLMSEMSKLGKGKEE